MNHSTTLLLFLISISLIACSTDSKVVTPLPPQENVVKQKTQPKEPRKIAAQNQDQSHKQRVLRTEQLLKELRQRKQQRQKTDVEQMQESPASTSRVNSPQKKAEKVVSLQQKIAQSKAQKVQERRKSLEQALATLKQPAPGDKKLTDAQKHEIINEIQAQLVKFKDVSTLLERDKRMNQLMAQVYFKFDDSQIPPQKRQELIESASFLLKELEQRGDLVLQIAGHADERGSEEYNLALGGRRAQSVYNFLRVYSSGPDILQPISFGEEFPAVPNSNERAWNLNRRVEFNLLPKE